MFTKETERSRLFSTKGKTQWYLEKFENQIFQNFMSLFLMSLKSFAGGTFHSFKT